MQIKRMPSFVAFKQPSYSCYLLGLQAVLVWLTAQPQVHWVSPRPKTRAANFFATGIGQSGNAASFAAASNGPGSAGDAGTHPLWDAGCTSLFAALWLKRMMRGSVSCSIYYASPCVLGAAKLRISCGCSSVPVLLNSACFSVLLLAASLSESHNKVVKQCFCMLTDCMPVATMRTCLIFAGIHCPSSDDKCYA